MTFHCNTKNRPLQPETEYIFMETIYLCIVTYSDHEVEYCEHK